DRVLATEILLHGRLEPRRRHVELYRTVGEAPPQAGDSDGGDRHGRNGTEEDAPDPFAVQEPPRQAPQAKRLAQERGAPGVGAVISVVPVLVRGPCHALCAPLLGRTIARLCPDTHPARSSG